MGKLPGPWVRWIVCILLAVLFLTETKAEEFSTTNRDCLAHFWVAAEGGKRPVTVVSFGDSMADSYQSVTYSLINSLAGRLGVAGYSLNNYANATEYRLTNGAQYVVGPTQFWFTDHYRLPSGGGLWWEAQNSPGGVYSDAVGVFWVSQPQGGWFTLSVSTAGQAWTPVVMLSGNGSTPEGHFARVFLAPDFHRVRVDGVSGINYIIGPQLLSQKTGGVHVVFMDKGGIGLDSVTNIPISIRQPILAALNPDLIVWHMKEDGSVATSNRMLECENWWSNAAPACDIAYIGTPYTAYDTNTTTTIDQNRLVRNIAVTKHRTYEDLMQPSVSYNWLYAQGYMVDAVHLNVTGGKYLANIMWNDLGFFALNVPRTLTLKFSGQKLTAEYPTVTGVYYALEMSTNWVNWLPIVSAPGSGQKLSTNVPASSRNAFFRLRLSPN
jgi:hypothetical protein